MRTLILGVALAASLAALMASTARARSASDPNSSYTYRILNNPTSGDAFGFRGAIQQNAQGMSNRLYSSLASLLGGDAPTLNAVPTGSDLLSDGDESANVKDFPGGPKGSVNMSPLAYEALTNSRSPWHDAGVGAMPHEYAHLHQSPQTLADLISREGGAQAFSEIVTPTAAQRARIPFKPGFASPYGAQVAQVQSRGRDWILAQQFGRSGSPTFP